MRVQRTYPPAAAPIPWYTIFRALPACLQQDKIDNTFEIEMKKKFNVKYCFALSSGKAALALILQALHAKFPERNQVLIPAFTCFSVPATIKRAGLQIRLCDLDKDSFDFNKRQLQTIVENDRHEKKILCILATHLFGYPTDIHAIKGLVKDQFPIVEDAAQAMGGEIEGKKLGTLGDVGLFSLGRGKALSAIEGGVILTNNKHIGEELSTLIGECKTYSISDKLKLTVKAILITSFQHPLLFWIPKSIPSLRIGETLYEDKFPIKKMSNVQRVLLHAWHNRLKTHQNHRKTAAKQWKKTLPPRLIPICNNIATGGMIRLPVLTESSLERDALVKQSDEHGYGIMPAYPTPINEIPEISSEFDSEIYPNAKQLSQRLMTLPVHDFMSDAAINHMAKMLK